jgi:hypothetical protein
METNVASPLSEKQEKMVSEVDSSKAETHASSVTVVTTTRFAPSRASLY